MANLSGARIKIKGIIQGVGFRPFVYGLATSLNLQGWVRNTSAGVDIELDGDLENIKHFQYQLLANTPPLARIDDLQIEYRPPDGYTGFSIIHSEPVEGAFQPISPDVSICNECLEEMLNQHDRRFLYPFINCTNCGPRFTIITDIPYDRPNTTMVGFDLCDDCRAEYENPLDRRFHAQPVACPVCGPQVWLEKKSDQNSFIDQITNGIPPDINATTLGIDAIVQAQKMLLNGSILAIKGLGGFHLACDATNHEAVSELRRRKLRIDKPFAVMMDSTSTVVTHCDIQPGEIDLIHSRQRPIVIVQKRETSNISREVAPNQDTLGVMLPYTPLHHLLFIDYESVINNNGQNNNKDLRYLSLVLVMTSGNLSEEPIAISNEEARLRLSPLVDAFLMHNRSIRTRCDDSVIRHFSLPESVSQSPDTGTSQLSPKTMPLRRSRGYSPDPILLPWTAPAILATGSELKNAFCLTRENYAFLSHHIGDMENYETLQSFEDGIQHFEKLFRIQPQAIAYDLHPNYLATRYALTRSSESSIPAFGIQHHHAHIVACMTEHRITKDRQVIGIAFDGTGYGDDGAIWGGEFLITDYRGYHRHAHLKYVPLPGGDASIRKPSRIALAHLWASGLEWESEFAPVKNLSAEEITALHVQLEKGINTPPTSSIGRLFDAAAALTGVRQIINYEAQAAIEFEALLDPKEDNSYEFSIQEMLTPNEFQPIPPILIDPSPLWMRLAEDVLSGLSVSKISARFHNAIARMVYEICLSIRKQLGVDQVALSGGVWQNVALLSKTTTLLQAGGFDVLVHHQVPPNDGGLALGQACIVANTIIG